MNYILVDRQNMTVVHKHESLMVLSCLNAIECARIPTIMLAEDAAQLRDVFSDFELKRLYKSITNVDMGAVYLCDTIIAATLAAISTVPTSVVNPVLANAQADYALAHSADEDDNLIDYRYCPTSVRPTPLLSFEWPKPLHGFALTVEQFAALPKTQTMRAPRAAPADGAVPSVQTPAPQRRESVAAVPGAPAATVGTRGASATVVQVADEMWIAAGKPMDPNVVLALRRDIMNHLEAEYGIKKTTSSTALGNWQKNRLSAV